MLCPTALHLQGFPLARGQGAFATILSLFYTTAMAIGGNESLVDVDRALHQPAIAGGGRITGNRIT